ncbi:fluoride efflux transporter CrcB [Arthrobacter sp. MSA 4-2]|uniref:fluoride efflux transporter CrcB n=1 Tax=Arthrobacter sp. MSA 4-2 TaxID=2794349 RepID=UPI0018E84A8A|nr:fluoride efflux transporter CrcB [Arthrobacter sp. MSA 4-2]MBJ2120602.1 fluoride efflux transporter CrcB [Arthrobacter sp. MSA 4-2]
MTGTVFALAAAGGLGAGARFLLDGMISSRMRSGFPLGTVLINISGSFLLGLLAGFAASAALERSVVLVVGTGFLGGYTTFSTASVDTVRLLKAGRRGLALLAGLGTLAGALGAAAAGFALAAA